MKHFKRTAFHVLELVIILVVVYGISRFFTIDSQLINGVVIAVLGGLAKFAREHESIPVKDWVNVK